MMEDDDLSGMKLNAERFRAAVATGMYAPFIAEEGWRIEGFAEAGLMLHGTRGWTMRIVELHAEGVVAARELVGVVCGRAKVMQCRVVYATPESMAFLSAVRGLGFEQTPELVMRRTRGAAMQICDPTGDIAIRDMFPFEYPEVRRNLLPLVSGGTWSADVQQIKAFMEGGLLRPMIAIAPSEAAVGYAELDLFQHVVFGGRTARIERVAVDPKARGKRLSRAIVGRLLQGVDAATDDQTVRRTELIVKPKNAPAIRTYEHLGFVKAVSDTVGVLRQYFLAL
jgi:ribosomal protein S18 acetylase RimI-like enzyme